jgi:hypothetical protein
MAFSPPLETLHTEAALLFQIYEQQGHDSVNGSIHYVTCFLKTYHTMAAFASNPGDTPGIRVPRKIPYRL